MLPVRRPRPAVVLASMAMALAACTSDKLLYPPAGTITLQIIDSGLGPQTSAVPEAQRIRWTLDAASVDISGFGSFSFLGRSPCILGNTYATRPDLTTQCGGTRLSLQAEGLKTAVVHLTISALELRRAWRPDLPPGGDYDGDGVSNGLDNCPLVPNPDQEPSDTATGFGTACTTSDPTTGTAGLADTDGDKVPDFEDGCIWTPDPAQIDSDLDGIGDACERVTRVVLTGQPMHIDLPAIQFGVRRNSLVSIIVDFDDRATLVNCDPGSTVCYLDPSRIKVTVQ